eukprot:SAG22_NODE_16_length_32723_cov_26.404825_2_plen_85_part_00
MGGTSVRLGAARLQTVVFCNSKQRQQAATATARTADGGVQDLSAGLLECLLGNGIESLVLPEPGQMPFLAWCAPPAGWGQLDSS